MDGKHPKRRRDKYNPYKIWTTEDNHHWLSFTDGQGFSHQFEINPDVFVQLNAFELEDISYFNEVDRHYEQSELTDSSLNERAVHTPESVEDKVTRNLRNEQLHTAICQLPYIQRRRLILYYFFDLTYEQIAEIEGCSHPAVIKSVNTALKKLKNILLA